jgi:hypothetical protein
VPADIVDLQQRRRAFVQQRMLLTIAHGVELEVARPRRLILGERCDKSLDSDDLERVVGSPLLTDRRAGFTRQVFAAR